MKVILLEDVKGSGKKGDIIEAKDGYCTNFLFPKKLAMPANKQNITELDNQKAKIAKVKANLLKEAKELSGKLSGKSFDIFVKAGEGGKLFGSVTNKEIAQAIEQTAGISVDKKKISADDALKALGEHKVSIKLHPEVETIVNVVLKPLEGR